MLTHFLDLLAAVISVTSLLIVTYGGTFIKYYKISQLIHTQSIAN